MLSLALYSAVFYISFVKIILLFIQLGQVGFKLADLRWGGVQTGNVNAIMSNRGISQANQISDKMTVRRPTTARACMATVGPPAPLQENLHAQVPLWNASSPMHTACGINRRNQASVRGSKAMISL